MLLWLVLTACVGPSGDDTGDTGDTGSAAGPPLPDALASPGPGEWPMFKRDLSHSGLALDMDGAIAHGDVCVLWDHKVSGPDTRAAGGTIVANTDEGWTVFVAVDGSCADDESACVSGLGNETVPGKVYALDGPGHGAVRWSVPLEEPVAQADPYAPLLADVDGDDVRELIVPSTNKPYMFRITAEGAGKGTIEDTMDLPTGHKSESAPSAANLDDDPALEILIGDDADPVPDDRARFLMYDGATGDLEGDVEIPNRQETDTEGCEAGGRKIDSSQPAIGIRDEWPTAYVGAWNGRIYAFDTRSGELDVAWDTPLPLNDDGNPCRVPKIRSSPTLADVDGDDLDDLIFGWMYQEGSLGDPLADDRTATATLQVVDPQDGTLGAFRSVGTWKSSPSVADLDPGVAGMELTAGRVGGVYSMRDDLQFDWDEGPPGQPDAGVRSSPAVADIDGDGDLEVIFGIEAEAGETDVGVYAYDAATGALEWSVPLGLDGVRYAGVSSSPALGDVDGDGQLEVVVLAADGVVTVLDACP